MELFEFFKVVMNLIFMQRTEIADCRLNNLFLFRFMYDGLIFTCFLENYSCGSNEKSKIGRKNLSCL